MKFAIGVDILWRGVIFISNFISRLILNKIMIGAIKNNSRLRSNINLKARGNDSKNRAQEE